MSLMAPKMWGSALMRGVSVLSLGLLSAEPPCTKHPSRASLLSPYQGAAFWAVTINARVIFFFQGVNSFLVFMAYKDKLQCTDAQVIQTAKVQ